MNQDDPNMILVKHRLRYNIDHRKKISLVLLGMVLLIGALLTFISVQLSTRIDPLYFKLTDNMQLIEPVALDQEGISKPALLNWVNDALYEMFSFNYSNIDRQISRLTPYFSENALQTYKDLLTLDDDFNKLEENQYVVSIKPTATPEILTSKAFRGRYAWQIRVPARIVFSNALRRQDQDVIIEFLVWRVLETESPIGILVANFSRRVVGRTGAQVIPRGF